MDIVSVTALRLLLEMTENELLRVIEFLERTRRPLHERLPIAEPDPIWNLVVHLVRSQLTGQIVTISTLTNVAGVPYATALRRVHKLIDEGWIECRPRTKSGKTFSLHPSADLYARFLDYAREVKGVLAQTFGRDNKGEAEEEYYFGGAHPNAGMAPPMELVSRRVHDNIRISFLLHDDNYFSSMRDMWIDFRSNLASRRDFELQPLPELHERLARNSAASASDFDVVTVNMPWLAEFAASGALRPLDDLIPAEKINREDFHPTVWRTGGWNGKQYGIPIYVTIEVLAVRKDWTTEAGLRLPRTFNDVLCVARALHAPERDRFGVVWNAASGMAVAHSFMFFVGCCGGTVLNLTQRGDGYLLEHLGAENMRPTIDNRAGRAALGYMHQLMEVSPSGILDYDWNRGLDDFLKGRAAMTYVWTMRAARFENDIHSMVKRRVAYLPHPAGPGGRITGPVGGFLLAVPGNLPPERARVAIDAIAWMAGPDAMKAHAKNGYPVVPRFSVSADPPDAVNPPIIDVVDRLARNNVLHAWQRPPVPEYRRIEKILGEEIHAALSAAKSDEAALRDAQERVDEHMRGCGYY